MINCYDVLNIEIQPPRLFEAVTEVEAEPLSVRRQQEWRPRMGII
jgi:hypothetical protein